MDDSERTEYKLKIKQLEREKEQLEREKEQLERERQLLEADVIKELKRTEEMGESLQGLKYYETFQREELEEREEQLAVLTALLARVPRHHLPPDVAQALEARGLLPHGLQDEVEPSDAGAGGACASLCPAGATAVPGPEPDDAEAHPQEQHLQRQLAAERAQRQALQLQYDELCKELRDREEQLAMIAPLLLCVPRGSLPPDMAQALEEEGLVLHEEVEPRGTVNGHAPAQPSSSAATAVFDTEPNGDEKPSWEELQQQLAAEQERSAAAQAQAARRELELQQQLAAERDHAAAAQSQAARREQELAQQLAAAEAKQARAPELAAAPQQVLGVAGAQVVALQQPAAADDLPIVQPEWHGKEGVESPADIPAAEAMLLDLSEEPLLPGYPVKTTRNWPKQLVHKLKAFHMVNQYEAEYKLYINGESKDHAETYLQRLCQVAGYTGESVKGSNGLVHPENKKRRDAYSFFVHYYFKQFDKAAGAAKK